ncbi:MAG: hypothetical protein GX268_12495 [Methanomicrobiales archaeon]|jgi:tetratricopeptide (TPR) repeat protein|nr:hypothetical protein [Methanomicrobiales archaeon]
MNKPTSSQVYSEKKIKKAHFIAFLILIIGCSYCLLPCENDQTYDSFYQTEDLYLDSYFGCNFKETGKNNDFKKPGPDKSAEYNNIGYELYISGNKEEALNYFKKAKYEDPDNLVAQSNYALVTGSQSALSDICANNSEYGAKICVINAENKLMQNIESERMEKADKWFI